MLLVGMTPDPNPGETPMTIDPSAPLAAALVDAVDGLAADQAPTAADLLAALAQRGYTVVETSRAANLVRLMGGIPGGTNTPNLWPRGHSYAQVAAAGDLDGYLGDVLDALDKSLERNRAICASYEEDRTALHRLRHDLAATGRILAIALEGVIAPPAPAADQS